MSNIHTAPPFDNEQAVTEGWSIFEAHCSGNGPYQLQCCDDDDVFINDYSAWKFVVERAQHGSEYHKSALVYLREHNPMEIAAIERQFGRIE